jgi:hypothetical protein
MRIVLHLIGEKLLHQSQEKLSAGVQLVVSGCGEDVSFRKGFGVYSPGRTERRPTMALTIELTPEQEAQLAAAAKKEGLDPAEFARKLVTEHLPLTVVGDEEDPTLALFAQWKEEDAQMTPEEIEQERRLWTEFETGVNETRRAQGMRQL